jgi:hypothetical protein
MFPAGSTFTNNGHKQEKRFMKSIFKTAGIALLLAGAVLAQPTQPNPATQIANQVARLTTLLDLTTAQAAQASTILTTAQTTISTLRTTLSTAQTSLESAITSNATSTITQLTAAIGTIDGQILDARSSAEAALYASLTTTQQAKVTTLGGPGILAGGGPGGRGGPGGPGGPGPRP